MPTCNEVVEIRQTMEPTDEAFVVHCVQSAGHQDSHSGHVWALGYNHATDEKGIFKCITWESGK